MKSKNMSIRETVFANLFYIFLFLLLEVTLWSYDVAFFPRWFLSLTMGTLICLHFAALFGKLTIVQDDLSLLESENKYLTKENTELHIVNRTYKQSWVIQPMDKAKNKKDKKSK
jgi:hypothetical protein